MAQLEIYTENNKKYLVNNKGQISRTDMAFTPSDGWKFQGIDHVKQSWFIPFKDINEDTLKTLPLRYKNGKGQFTIRDLDHGTARVWSERILWIKVIKG